MASLHPGITGRADLEPLAVAPRQACVLLSIGNTRLYELLRSGELESYLEGRSRRITMQSIHRRITRLLTSANTAGTTTEDMLEPRRPGRKAKHEGCSGHRRPRARRQEGEPGAAE
jgi:excisionase family DNA binding protein